MSPRLCPKSLRIYYIVYYIWYLPFAVLFDCLNSIYPLYSALTLFHSGMEVITIVHLVSEIFICYSLLSKLSSVHYSGRMSEWESAFGHRGDI